MYNLMLADGVEPKWSSDYLAFHAHLWRGAEGDLDRALELQQGVIKGNPHLKKKTQELVIKACTGHVRMGRSCVAGQIFVIDGSCMLPKRWKTSFPFG